MVQKKCIGSSFQLKQIKQLFRYVLLTSKIKVLAFEVGKLQLDEKYGCSFSP